MKKPTSKRAPRFFITVASSSLCVVSPTTAFATGGDPITVVNNLSDFIFSAIKAIGIIIPWLGHRPGRYVDPEP